MKGSKEAELVVTVSGNGQARSADYLHLPLTNQESIVLFGYQLEGLDADASLQFTLTNLDEDDDLPPFQAAFFQSTCREDDLDFAASPYTSSLPVGEVKLAPADATPEPPPTLTLTPTLTATLTNTVALSTTSSISATTSITSTPIARTANITATLTTPTATPTPTFAPTRVVIRRTAGISREREVCPNTYLTRLQVGEQAYVTTDDLLNVRSALISGRPNKVGQLTPGNVVTIIGGPDCSQEMIWWRIQDQNGLEGWTSEGYGQDTFLTFLAGSDIVSAPSAGTDSQSCTIQPSSTFRNVWNQYANQLGCAQQANPISGFWAEQPFQNGHMFWTKDAKNYLITVGNNEGWWRRYQDDRSVWNENMPQRSCDITIPDGLRQPVRGFGSLWCRHNDIRSQIGWAVDDERGFQNGVSIYQEFDGGIIFRDSDGMTRGLVYVMFFGGGTFV